jgi:hypothetical protein
MLDIIKSEQSKENNNSLDIKLKLLNNLGNTVSGLQKNIDVTSNNLPIAYIDPQIILEEIIDNSDANANISQELITLSTTFIDYLDGVPIVGGLPFWERLDCEPLDYYRLFKTYRDYKLIEPKRSFEKLEADTNTPRPYLYALSKVYHWQQRALAFDIYKMDEIERERNRQVSIMENKHKKAAERIFEICTTYLEVMEETGLLAAYSPKEMQGWAELAIKLERLSLGLSPDKPITKEDTEKVKQIVNVTNNQMNQTNLTNQQLTILPNDPMMGLSEDDRKKFLQDVTDTLLKASPEVILGEPTSNSEPDDETGIIVIEPETNTEIN